MAFSVAAHLDSEIMVMDEVLAVGDMKFQQKCLGKMDNAAQQDGRTVLYVSHNMNTIRQLCSRCVVLDHGKMIFNGDVESAIQIYMDANDNSYSRFVDYTKKKHLYCTKRVMFQSATLYKDDNVFSENEDISITFRVSSDNDYSDIRFMMILSHRDGTRIGKTESPNFNIEKGEHDINLKFPCEGLADGEYHFEINILRRNDYGAYEKYDSVDETLPFKIANQDVFGVKGETWNARYWGHIMLKPLKLDR